MGVIPDCTKPVDVICQMNRDGSMFPIKIRLKDEDGQEQTYVIRGYRELGNKSGIYAMPNGFTASANQYRNYECKIVCFDREVILHIFYNSTENIWYIINAH